MGQDSDLARAGKAHVGKTEGRKELGLLASFHPHVLVVQTATSMQAHFLKNTVEFLSYGSRPGRPDLLVGFRGRTYLLEVKSAGRKLRASQVDWHRRWRGAPVVTVWTATDALRAVGALSPFPDAA